MTDSKIPKRGLREAFFGKTVLVVALLMVLYHLVIVWHPFFGEMMNQNAHLGFCLVLVLLSMAHSARNNWSQIGALGGAVLSLGLIIYMGVEYERLDMYAGFPEPRDVAVGVALIGLVLFLTWKNFGAIFPILVLTGIAYALWGHHLPGIMHHPPLEFGYIVSNLSVGFQGIYGMLLNVSANVLFLLVIFGSIFQATGITRFFMEFGQLISRHVSGGAGQTAVFSSSFVGMVNGVAAANVAITGSYTIPVMKQSGFSGEEAAAIEAMASTGGQLTPPIMGIAVFIMANLLGISYVELMGKALVPAVSYYIIAVLGVMLIAARRGIPLATAPVDLGILRQNAPLFLVPMGVLIFLLFRHHTVANAAFWGITSLLAISFLRRATRPDLRLLLQNLIGGARLAATFGLAVACIGILVKCMTFTGLATKLSLLITTIAGQSLLPTLVMTMILSILLSSSTPTVIAYVVVAFLAAPILTEMGVDRIVSHFFVFYFAILAAVTPPVAGAAIVGSQLAQASYMKSSWESFKLVGPFFILPYFIVKNPVILSGAQAPATAIMALISLVIAMGGLMCCAQGYCFARLGSLQRTMFAGAALMAVFYGLYHEVFFFFGALLLACGLMAQQWRQKLKAPKAVAA
ncbi:MAG: TRAP transporter permease [Desulfosalsimonas sp.]